jgi:hypothetical protein
MESILDSNAEYNFMKPWITKDTIIMSVFYRDNCKFGVDKIPRILQELILSSSAHSQLPVRVALQH